jgi:hypothetical protein
MRWLLAILVLLPLAASAQMNLTTESNWQSVVQTAAPSSWFAFAAGTYTTTGTSLNVTSGWTRIQGAGPGQSYITSGHATNWGVVQLTGPEIVLDGFTIYGGSTSNYGGGVRGTGGQTVSNCVIVSNRAFVGGGAFLVNIHNSTVAHNFTYGNFVLGLSGAGGMLSKTNVASASVVSNNSALEGGGGLSGHGTDYASLVVDCDVVNNSARNGGGIFYVTATNSRIWRNAATNASQFGGGGAYYANLFDCSVVSNVTTKAGGGAYNVYAARNSTFAHNSAGTSGGGGYGLYGTNMTFRYNVAGTSGGGMHAGLAAFSVFERNVANGSSGGGAFNSTIFYSIIVSNRGYEATGPGGGVAGSTAESCVFVDNWWTNAFGPYGGGQDLWNSSIVNCTILNTNAAAPLVQWSGAKNRPVANTLIVHASSTQILDNTAAVWTNVAANYFTNSADGLFLPDDPPYRLPPDSPLIDAGYDALVVAPLDLYGRARQRGTVDVGAVEYQPETDAPPSATTERKRRFLFILGGSL